MENKAQGTIWNGPVQFKLPDSDYAGKAANVSFFGHMKLSDKEPNASRPADPFVRWKSVGTDWKRPVWTPVPDGKGILLNEGWKVAVCPPADYTESRYPRNCGCWIHRAGIFCQKTADCILRMISRNWN